MTAVDDLPLLLYASVGTGNEEDEVPNKKARLISEPKQDTRTIIAPQKGPAFKGDGGNTIECGACEALLVDSLGPNVVIENVVVKCPSCGSFNEI